MELEAERESNYIKIINYTEKVVEEKVREERTKLDEEMRIWMGKKEEEEEFRERKRKIREVENKLKGEKEEEEEEKDKNKKKKVNLIHILCNLV